MDSKNKPIRVAHIMGKLWAGGVENVVFNYYRKINKDIIQFDFYYDEDSTMEPPQDLIDMGAKFVKVPPYQNLAKYISELKVIFKEENYTIVHSHINTLSVFPLAVAWFCKIPIRIAHNHSVPGGKEIKRNILKYVLRMFSKVFSTHYFACSEKAGRWLFGNQSYNAGKVKIIKNAVDFEKFNVDDKKNNFLKDKYNLKGKTVIGHVGRFTFAKNHAFLIEIFEKVSKVDENVRLVLVGDGELHDKIKDIIKEKELEDKVVFIGQVSNPEEYYCLIDVMVMPSIFEGLSLTTIESQVAKVPVVVSECIPDEAIISNGVKKLSLNAPVEVWKKAIIDFINVEVVLNNKSVDYNIEKQVYTLEKLYLKMNNRMEI